MPKRKRTQKSSKLFLLHSKNSWNEKDRLPGICQLENEYYCDRGGVSVEEDHIPTLKLTSGNPHCESAESCSNTVKDYDTVPTCSTETHKRTRTGGDSIYKEVLSKGA